MHQDEEEGEKERRREFERDTLAKCCVEGLGAVRTEREGQRREDVAKEDGHGRSEKRGGEREILEQLHGWRKGGGSKWGMGSGWRFGVERGICRGGKLWKTVLGLCRCLPGSRLPAQRAELW